MLSAIFVEFFIKLLHQKSEYLQLLRSFSRTSLVWILLSEPAVSPALSLSSRVMPVNCIVLFHGTVPGTASLLAEVVQHLTQPVLFSIGSGISIWAFSISFIYCFIFFCSLVLLLLSFLSRFFFTSALYSARVSNSEASCAKSSSSSGSSFALLSLTSHWNTAALPASSFAWYSSGNVTFTSTSSPALAPTS